MGERWFSAMTEIASIPSPNNEFELAEFFTTMVRGCVDFFNPINPDPRVKTAGSDEPVTLTNIYCDIHLGVEYSTMLVLWRRGKLRN